jgi:hypothetical protein
LGKKISLRNSDSAKKSGFSFSAVGKDFYISSSFRSSYNTWKFGKTEWKNGRPVKYSRATNDVFIRCFGVIRDQGKRLEFVFHEAFDSVSLPEGYLFAEDNLGLKVVKDGEPDSDFHFYLEHLQEGAESLIGALESNLLKRKEAQKLEKERNEKETRELEGVYVCVKDSLSAGNCLKGTLEFIRQNGLDERKHYPAKILYSKFSGNQRFRIAALKAAQRHKTEMSRGYSNLADHLVNS